MAISFVGAAENSTTNGNPVVLSLPSSIMQAGDCVIVAYAVPRAITMNVASSGGTQYSQIVSTVTNGNLNFSAWRRIIPDVETTATCSGTGNGQDGDTAVALVFRGVDQSTPEDVTSGSTTGTGTTPDSPSITVLSSNDAIISAVAALVSDTTVTAPSSFLDQTDINASDTRSTTTGIAWITHNSTAAFDPASWTGFTSANWCSATIALRAASTAEVVHGWTDSFSNPVMKKSELLVAHQEALSYGYFTPSVPVIAVSPEERPFVVQSPSFIVRDIQYSGY